MYSLEKQHYKKYFIIKHLKRNTQWLISRKIIKQSISYVKKLHIYLRLAIFIKTDQIKIGDVAWLSMRQPPTKCILFSQILVISKSNVCKLCHFMCTDFHHRSCGCKHYLTYLILHYQYLKERIQNICQKDKISIFSWLCTA